MADLPRASAGTVSMAALLPLAAAMFINTYDSTAMNVALSDIASDLNTTITGVQSAITLYALVMAAFMITGSKLGNLLGPKRAFRIGILIYGSGALITAVSPNLAVLLIGWSLIEGVGSAIAQPTVLQIATSDYRGESRTRAFALISAATGLAIGLAPIVAGLITTTLTWRVSFAGEALVVLVILVLGRRLGPDAARPERASFDLGGAALSAAGIGLVVLGILQAGQYGWLRAKKDVEIAGTVVLAEGGISPVVVLVALGFAVLAWWVLHERRRKAQDRDPLVDLALFRIPAVVGGLLGQLAQWLTQNGTLFIVPVFVQIVLGYNAIETGLTLLPMSGAILAASVVGARVVDRVGRGRLINAGFILMLGGGLLMIGVISPDSSGASFLAPLILFGAGMGLLISQLQELVQASAPPQLVDAASGVSKSVSYLGGSLGTAIGGAVMISVLVSTYGSLVADSQVIPGAAKPQIEQGLADAASAVSNDQVRTLAQQAGAAEPVQQEIVRINAEANVTAIRQAVAVLTGIGVVNYVLLVVLVRRRHPARRARAPSGFTPDG
jgi:MFS family permease